DLRADAHAAEARIHDVRAVIDGLPWLDHELDVQRIDVAIPDLPGVLAVPTCSAHGHITRVSGAVGPIVVDVTHLRFGGAVGASGDGDAAIHRELGESSPGRRGVHQ